MRSFLLFLQQLSQSIPFLFVLLRGAAKGIFRDWIVGQLQVFANNLLRLVNVITVDRQAYVPRWKRQLR